MKKQQRSTPTIQIEWMHDAVGDPLAGGRFCEADLRSIAQALGRLAARRDLARARAARSQSAPNSAAMLATNPTKALN